MSLLFIRPRKAALRRLNSTSYSAYKCGVPAFVNVGEGNVAAKLSALESENVELRNKLSLVDAKNAHLESRLALLEQKVK